MVQRRSGTLRTPVQNLAVTGEKPVFAFYLANQVDGELAFGGVNSAHRTEILVYMNFESASYWQVNWDDLKLYSHLHAVHCAWEGSTTSIQGVSLAAKLRVRGRMSWCPRELSREHCFFTFRSSGDDNETFPLEAVDGWISKLSRMSRKSCWRGASHRATMITVGFQLP